MPLRPHLAAILFLLYTCLVSAQDQPPTFRSRADLVTVPVVVTRDGKPVRGLTKEDFQLLHNGKGEAIAVFEEVGDRRTHNDAKPELPQNAVQNYVRADSQDVVIVVLRATDWYSYNNIRSSLSDMAKQFASTRTPVSVLVLGVSGLVQVHSFTAMPEDLVKSVDEYLARDQARRSTDVALTTREEADERRFTVPNASLSIEEARLQDTRLQLDAVTQISKAYRGVPGRKKLIWMSAGFFSDGAGAPGASDWFGPFRAAEAHDQAWQALSDANIAVYPLDTLGDTNPAWDEHFSAAQNGGANFERNFGGARRGGAPSMERIQGMLKVAQKTGGQNCTDLPVRCLKTIQADATEYYVLGFYLPKDAKPGWHQVKVETNQQGVSVRARDGFIVESKVQAMAAGRPAPQPASVLKVSDAINSAGSNKPQPVYARDEVLTALAAPLDYTSIPLRLRWTVSGSGKEPRKVELFVSSPAGGVSFDPQDPTLRVDFLAFVREAAITQGTSFPESLVRKLSLLEQQRLSTAGFAFRKVLNLPPGRYGLRILVRDNVTKKIGTVSALLALR